MGVGAGGVGLLETPLGVLQLWRGFGSGRSKLRFRQTVVVLKRFWRVLQLRCCATGCNRFVEHLDSDRGGEQSQVQYIF